MQHPVSATRASAKAMSRLRERVLEVQESLLVADQVIPASLLEEARDLLRPADYDLVVDERSNNLVCGYPCCINKLEHKPGAKQRFSISSKRIQAYRAPRFCSGKCATQSTQYAAGLSDEPVFLRDSFVRQQKEAKAKQRREAQSRASAASASGGAGVPPKRPPKKKRVAFSGQVTEHSEAEAPNVDFSGARHAAIEGYVPSLDAQVVGEDGTPQQPALVLDLLPEEEEVHEDEPVLGVEDVSGMSEAELIEYMHRVADEERRILEEKEAVAAPQQGDEAGDDDDGHWADDFVMNDELMCEMREDDEGDDAGQPFGGADDDGLMEMSPFTRVLLGFRVVSYPLRTAAHLHKRPFKDALPPNTIETSTRLQTLSSLLNSQYARCRKRLKLPAQTSRELNALVRTFYVAQPVPSLRPNEWCFFTLTLLSALSKARFPALAKQLSPDSPRLPGFLQELGFDLEELDAAVDILMDP